MKGEYILQLVSVEFIIFFIFAIFLLSACAYKNKKIVLLAFNIVFYLWAGVQGAIIFLFFALFTYFSGLFIKKQKNKLLFSLILVVSLLPLFFFKYISFIVTGILGLPPLDFITTLSAPLGVSFFTFQGVGYLIDVYKNKCESEKNFFNYFTFLSLFTCISSGPINRSEALLTQIKNYDKTTFDYDRAVLGVRYILIGVFMKVFIAGCLSKVQPVSQENGLVLLIASVFYSVEIYCDFCGYSYIAFGLSKILGLDVIQNFDVPYNSVSITEFWRRWHISLSSWLRDYVYIPLGGSRCSKARNIFNTLVTFIVSGIWHGANWTFIVWGFLNGLFIVIEKLMGLNKPSSSKIVTLVRKVVVLCLVNTLWIFFDAPTITYALDSIKSVLLNIIPDVLSLGSMGAINTVVLSLGIGITDFLKAVMAFGCFIILEYISRKHKEPVGFFQSKYTVVRYVKYYLILIIILLFGAIGEAGAFIYANF